MGYYPGDLPFDIFIKGSINKGFPAEGRLKEANKDFEKQYIGAVLEKVNGSQSKAARILGISQYLLNKINNLGLKK